MQQPDLYKISMDGSEFEFTTAIVNGTVLTMDDSFTRYDHGMVLISGNTIIYTGHEQKELLKNVPPSSCLDAEGGIVIPGLINTHTHIGMSFFRTLADDRADRLKKYIFPLEKKFVNPELVYWASLHTISEMLLGGTTMFADMYYFEEMTARAAGESGMRAIAGESVISSPGPDASGFEEGLEITRNLVRNFKDSEMITPAVAPHAPYSLTRNDLELTASFSEENNIPVLSHLAEMPFEEAYTLERHNMRPVPFYDSCGLLTDRSIMAHCIFTEKHDRTTLISRGTGIAHNTGANAKSGKGIAPAYEFYIEGARIGLGTDGPMSGNTMDIIHQLNAVSKFQKTRLHDPTIMTPRQVLEMATIRGAQALHMENSTGSLEPGKRADITIISTDSPAMFPVYDPYAAVVYCASPSDVRTVVSDGKVLVNNKKLLSLDTAGIREAASAFTERIRREADRLV